MMNVTVDAARSEGDIAVRVRRQDHDYRVTIYGKKPRFDRLAALDLRPKANAWTLIPDEAPATDYPFATPAHSRTEREALIALLKDATVPGLAPRIEDDDADLAMVAGAVMAALEVGP